MKIFLLIALVSLCAVGVQAQVSSHTAWNFRIFTAEPSTCSPSDVYYNSTTHKNRQCLTANTWSDFGTGSGAVPGGSDTQLQFNNAGAFGGVTGSSASSSTGDLALGSTALLPGKLVVTQPWTDGDVGRRALVSVMVFNPDDDTASDQSQIGIEAATVILPGNTKEINSKLTGLVANATTYGSGDVTVGLNGGYFSTNNLGTSHIHYTAGVYIDPITNSGGGTVDGVYGLRINVPRTTGGSTTTSSSAVWIDDQTDGSPLPYAFWYDSDGVYRIKGDGVMAYYNPTFEKYTPGAVDFERVVQQWNTNVLEYGTEAGGTGVQRDLRLLAPNVIIPGVVSITGTISLGASGIMTSNGSGLTFNGLGATAGIAGDFTINAPVLYGGGGHRVAFEGITSSFPSLKRSGTALQFRLADDSGDSPLQASTATLTALASDAATVDNSVCVTAVTGVLTKGSGTLGICLGTSSARYKNRIYNLSDGLSSVTQLQPKRFFYRQGYGDSGAKENVGFIAEEAAAVFPNLVGRDESGKPNTFDMMGLIPSLVNSIKELNAKVDAQAREIKRLKRQRKK